MLTPYPLGRNVNHDPRSRVYRVSGPADKKTVRWNRLTPVLDQGDLGSCTGNAGTGCLGTAPYTFTYQPAFGATLNEDYAVKLYSDATMIDSDPAHWPPTDTGSDGLSIAKVLKARGLISGYQHAFGIEDAFTAIQQGPLMVGTVWLQSMFSPSPDGYVEPAGPVVGGHEYECIGYDAATDRWEFVNSWGAGWAVGGHFFMGTAAFAKLLGQQGDIVLLIPVSQPAPIPTPAPTDAKTQAKQYLDTWAAARHTGSNARAAAAWKTYAAT